MQRANKGHSSWAPLISACCAGCNIPAFRSRAIRLICRFEGGQMWSQSFRTLLGRHYGVEVGIHSYGSCLWPGRLPAGTRIGNYCSFADGIVALRRNHTIDRISQHPFFYNASLGLVDRGTIPDSSSNPLTIGHDVWIGLNVLIMPSCRTIGDSAVIAAGAVVTADVPSFAVIGGVPAKHLRWRFPQGVQEGLMASEWWLKPVWELADYFDLFMQTTTPEIAAALASTIQAKTNAPASRHPPHSSPQPHT